MRLALVILLPFTLLAAVACQQNSATAPADSTAATANTAAPTTDSVIMVVDNQEFFKLTQKTGDVNLVDVRTPEEYGKSHIYQAVNIDFQDRLFRNKIAELDRQKPVALYCASGIRSHKAAETMAKMGFQKIYELEYGLHGWYRPLVSGDMKKG